MILVESRYFLVAVVRSAVAVIVRGHYQQLGAVLRGLRLFRRAVLDLRRDDRQPLYSLRQAFLRQVENDIETLARFRYQAFFMIFERLYLVVAFMIY